MEATEGGTTDGGAAAAAAPVAWRTIARNLSRQAENRIHDDSVARRIGFAGALVPGVEVYAALAQPAVARWGAAWLAGGRATCRFLLPVYDAATMLVRADATGDGLDLAVESDGRICAVGTASLDPSAAGAPDPAAFRGGDPPATRPPADATSLAPGVALGTAPWAATRAAAREYATAIGDDAALYDAAGALHPGLLLRLCNRALVESVALGPWIHTGSRVRNLALAPIEARYRVRGRVAANYERRGHRMVDLDLLVLADERPVARVAHSAIWQPRQLAALT